MLHDKLWICFQKKRKRRYISKKEKEETVVEGKERKSSVSIFYKLKQKATKFWSSNKEPTIVSFSKPVANQHNAQE